MKANIKKNRTDFNSFKIHDIHTFIKAKNSLEKY